MAYAFPPFNLIPSVLQKAKKEHAALVLVAPLWITQPWWPLLIELLVDYTVYLENNPKLLQDVSSTGAMHPLLPSLRLAVWRISGNVIKQWEFQKKLSNSSAITSRAQPPKHTMFPGPSGVAGVRRGKVIIPVSDVLIFLAEQSSQSKEYRYINVLRSAISSAHCHVDDKPVGQHPLIVRLMKGVSFSRPPQPRYQHTWNVSVVTAYLASSGINKTMSMKQLSQKLCMLMALTCPERSSVMASLDITYMRHYPGGMKFSHTIFRKRAHQGNLGESVYLKFTDESLCPVTCRRSTRNGQRIGEVLTRTSHAYSFPSKNLTSLYPPRRFLDGSFVILVGLSISCLNPFNNFYIF